MLWLLADMARERRLQLLDGGVTITWQETEELRRDIIALRRVLRHYRTRHGIPQAARQIVTPDQIVRFVSRSAKEMLREWAELHDGEIVMADMGQFLCAAGFYRTTQQAAATLYATVRRMPELEKIVPGHYRLRAAADRPRPDRPANSLWGSRT